MWAACVSGTPRVNIPRYLFKLLYFEPSASGPHRLQGRGLAWKAVSRPVVETRWRAVSVRGYRTVGRNRPVISLSPGWCGVSAAFDNICLTGVS